MTELIKCDWSIHSLSEISERFLASWTRLNARITLAIGDCVYVCVYVS